MTKDELCAEIGIFAENDEIILEKLSEKYKDEYMDLVIEVSSIKKHMKMKNLKNMRGNMIWKIVIYYYAF